MVKDKKQFMKKTPGLNNPGSYVLTHIRFNTYLVLFFSDLKKARIFKIPYGDSPHDENKTVLSFNYLNLFKSNEHIED